MSRLSSVVIVVPLAAEDVYTKYEHAKLCDDTLDQIKQDLYCKSHEFDEYKLGRLSDVDIEFRDTLVDEIMFLTELLYQATSQLADIRSRK